MDVFLEAFDVRAAGRGSACRSSSRWPTRTANALEVVCPADLGTMHADQTKVRQTLFNLLSNASKFTSKGTSDADA